MKKISLILFALALSASSLFALTPSKQTATTTLGSAAITNGQDYTVWKLVGIDATGVLPAISTGTVSFVQDGITSTLGTVITSDGSGSITATGSVYVFKTGKIAVAGLGTNTGASLRFVFENYP